jgi:hypothetical protein
VLSLPRPGMMRWWNHCFFSGESSAAQFVFTPFQPVFPAFPSDKYPGMAMYDYIAVAALQAVIAGQPGATAEMAASKAVGYADELVKQLTEKHASKKPTADHVTGKDAVPTVMGGLQK